MNRLVALDLPAGPQFVDALRRTWDDGDAVFPVDQRLPPVARESVLAAMTPSVVESANGRQSRRGGRPVTDATALVVATSGSTGEPKGVVLSHSAVAASARATSSRLGVAADDRWLACLPLSHVGGLSVVTRAVVTGTPLTVLPVFDAGAVVEAASKGATLVSLVPTALTRVDPTVFRWIVLGGSRPPADRPPNVVATYGMTETGSGVVYDGVPLDGAEVRVDPHGEIHLRGPMLFEGYRDGSDPRTADGWLPTGDLGHWRADGRLHVEGRRGDLIITGGENVWPEAVEAVLRGAPGVADVAVTGAADDEWGQMVTALVVPTAPNAPPSLDSLRGWVKQVLPAFCAPRRLIVVEELPRTTLGKLRRADVAALVTRRDPDSTD